MIDKSEKHLTYGLVSRLSVEELYELKQYIKEKQLRIIYDKISPNPLTLIEIEKKPSKKRNGDVRKE